NSHEDTAEWVRQYLFRRPVSPEPITEEQINAERARQIEKGHTPEHDRKHGIAHVLRYVLHYGSRGEHLKAYAMVEAALEIAPSVGVQGEPKLIECPHWSPGRVTMRKSCAACEAVQDEPQVMLRRANGSPKSNDEIRAEAAAIRDHVRALTGLTDAGLTELGGFQGEPTDAQADAAQKAFHEFTFGPDDDFLTPRRMGITRQAWKAALRAAFNETGEKR
ncbi:MAG TPA: hypothetical protein VN041_14110, partial [Microbacterium sp.]|nr:hypothetical protein [Microbacterium sp.]